VAATKAGTDACQRYHEIRERLVVKPIKATGLPDPTLRELGRPPARSVRPLRPGSKVGQVL